MKSFRAKIWSKGPKDAWSGIDIPFDVEKEFGAKGRVSVKATLGKEIFHTSIFPNGDGTHHMMFNKAMKKAASADSGDTIAVKLERDKGEEPDIPAPLKAALKTDAGAAAKFKALTPACRREYANWIMSAKREETRADRSAKTLKIVLAGKKRPSD
ncbi:MAG TPA: YdeI/OmpD-associated family protein [Rhizomicrobium sp.]|jgi:hypothetical protein|nr:YdeI/OmpD-associated family protein [Rhizomicrobium sp.]